MKTKKLKQDILDQWESIGFPKQMDQRNRRKQEHFPILEIGQERPTPPPPPPVPTASCAPGITG